jgi:predicted DNA-binding transcriptional regulator YafY
MRRADRLIRIVHFLRGRRRAVTAKRIAQEFEICTRTVYRDIQDLMNSGAPINGEAGVGYVIDKQYYLPPVTFDADELEAIGLGISMVCHWTDDRFAEKAESAFAKIKAVLPASLQGELEQITTYSIANQTALPWTVSFSDLRECIRVRRKIRIRYTNELQQETNRTLRPLAVIFCSPVWLLAGWCEKRNDFRNFRLDRIRTVEFSEDTFDDENDKNLSAYKAQDALC